LSPVFPVVTWGSAAVTFRPFVGPPCGCDAQAALVFAFQGDCVLLADIAGRGWCIPGGRIEAGETAREAAEREAREECGALLEQVAPLGCTVAVAPDGTERRLAANFVASVARLEPIPPHSESRGIRLARRSELPELYYRWDALIGAAFDFAWTRRGSVTS